METQQKPHKTPASHITDLIGDPLRVGERQASGALSLFPIFGGESSFAYTSLSDGLAHGASVGELRGGASVNDLTIHNPTPMALMLYEGQEVLGAQQNRTTDVTVIVGSGQKLTVPVSCVEHGRWDGSRHGEQFKASPQAAYPELRRDKARQARERVAESLDARADQLKVWNSIAARRQQMGVSSPTGAMHDLFESRRAQIGEFTEATQLQSGQTGSLVAIAGKLVVLDWVSRETVYADLHPALVQGYALDALEQERTADAVAHEHPSQGEAEGFLQLVLDNRTEPRAPLGIGSPATFEGNGSEGSILAVGDELAQLTAFVAGSPAV